MNGVIDWFEAHEALSGWAQFAGAMIALFVTAWIAGGEGRARRRGDADRMKGPLALLTMAYNSARHARDDANAFTGRGRGDILRVHLRSIAERQTTLDNFTAADMTSTFMVNNLEAAKGQIGTLVDLLEKATGPAPPPAFGGPTTAEIMQLAVQGLQAICSNVGSEVTRLGGRFEAHDDPQLSLWLRATKVQLMANRIRRWRERRRRVVDE